MARLGHLERGFVVIIGRHSGFGRDGSSRVIDMIEPRSIETVGDRASYLLSILSLV